MNDLSKYQVSAIISDVLNNDILSEIQSYVANKAPDHLWGSEKPRTFLEDMVLLALYKDIKNEGYHTLTNKINFHYKITDHSLRHNIPIIRSVMKEWAEEQIKVGVYQDWKTAARHCSLGPLVADTVLWIDSSDFQVINNDAYTPSSEHWSYKENSPARRFMVISDAKGRVRMVWGGYIPKMYDGEFLENNKYIINHLFYGAAIIGDNHFSNGKKIFKQVKFYTNFAIRQTAGKKRRRGQHQLEDEAFVDHVTMKQKQFNKQHQSGRARVESPFGLVKKMFKCLDKPFFEDWDQLDCVVRIALAVHNKKLEK